jgi:hypothetical protein
MPAMQDMLADHYGTAFMVVSIIVAYLRHKTTGPAGAK